MMMFRGSCTDAAGWSGGEGNEEKLQKVEPCGQLASIVPLKTVAERCEAVRVMDARYGPALLKYLKGLCGCESTAEDLRGKLYAKLERGSVRKVKNMGEADECCNHRKSAGGTVFTAAKNLFRDFWRKQQRESEKHEQYVHQRSDVIVACPLAHMLSVERDEIVRAALAQLPRDEREAITLILFEGNTFVDAGRRMGRCPSGVHQLCSRGFAVLRTKLDPGLMAA
ncbi:MAG: RNA polymerase sigma factor [Planctomycetes bacterium]|nr:RNA polymerase sigma factor [Planctomycetota bacterium]